MSRRSSRWSRRHLAVQGTINQHASFVFLFRYAIGFATYEDSQGTDGRVVASVLADQLVERRSAGARGAVGIAAEVHRHGGGEAVEGEQLRALAVDSDEVSGERMYPCES